MEDVYNYIEDGYVLMVLDKYDVVVNQNDVESLIFFNISLKFDKFNKNFVLICVYLKIIRDGNFCYSFIQS